MSRAMILSLPEADVRKGCDEDGISISVIETLPSGETRLVCTTGAEADAMRRRLGAYLIERAITEPPSYRVRGSNQRTLK